MEKRESKVKDLVEKLQRGELSSKDFIPAQILHL